jgi:hypothetical protein
MGPPPGTPISGSLGLPGLPTVTHSKETPDWAMLPCARTSAANKTKSLGVMINEILEGRSSSKRLCTQDFCSKIVAK